MVTEHQPYCLADGPGLGDVVISGIKTNSTAEARQGVVEING